MASGTGLSAVTIGTILECVFYGAYVVLFVLYLVLQRRNNRGFDQPLTLAHILLFVLCTITFFLDIPSGYMLLVPDARGAPDTARKLTLGSVSVFAIIDFLAQMILLYRCWIIWGKRWVVVIIPGSLALLTLGGGFALAGLFNSPLWGTNPAKVDHLFILTGTATNSVSLTVNALTTLLIVTRIVLTSREIRSALGSNSHHSLRIATALLIESGLLILAFQLVYVILFGQDSFNIISAPTPQIYGITPTLLNIRVAMGAAYDKTTGKTRTLRFAHSDRATTHVTGPSMSAAGVQSRDINIEVDDVPNSEGAADDAV
ncbi:hypothetical protein BD779DRAFT_1011820 [Infundibulicybe gibba]|nr:hypothetical protein BD779DRAFT_1011820 [Infundibulicybe gibba]